MEKITEKIDGIKEQISDGDYLDIMNELKLLYDRKSPSWEDLVQQMEDRGVGDHLTEQQHMILEMMTPNDLPLEMAITIQTMAKRMVALQSVIVSQALIIHE